MKVLLVSPLPPPEGGIAIWTKQYKEYCLVHGIKLKIVNIALVGKRAVKINDRGSLISEIKRTVRILRDFKKKVKYFHPDIVHINTSCAKYGIFRDAICVRIAWREEIPIFLHCRCDIKKRLDGLKYQAKVFQKMIRLSNRVLVLNTNSEEYARKIDKNKTVVIPNFIKPITYRVKKINDEIKNIIFVGHVQIDKGYREIVSVAKHFPEKTFILAGPVCNKVSHLKIPNNVQILGACTNDMIFEKLIAADLFLFPSYAEGFSNALVEAMAVGLPVIATDVGANRAMIEDKGGALVRVGSVDEIIAAMGSISNRNTREQMSSWNIMKVKTHYSITAIMNQLMNEYRKVIV